MSARTRVAVLVMALGLLRPGGGTAQATSFEGAAFLLLPVGAHGVSLGRAATVMAGQESVFWNPAGLGGLAGSRFLMVRGESAAGTSTAMSVLWARPGVGVLGVSYLLWDAGTLEERDRGNQLSGTLSLRNQLAIVSAAAPLVGALHGGVNLKLARFSLGCRGTCSTVSTSARTVAVDAGVQLVPTDGLPLRVGAMVAHAGPRFQHENAEQADPLPTRIRVAAAFDVVSAFLDAPDLEGWLVMEVQERVGGPGSLAVYTGAEVVVGGAERLALRAGYVAVDRDQPTGMSVGMGVQAGSFELSAVKSFTFSELADAVDRPTVVLSILF